MTRSIGAQIGLLAFAVALVAGLYAGNSATVALTRALLAMVLGLFLGQMIGWGAKAVLRDHLQKKKLAIDSEHVAAVRILVGDADGEVEIGETEPAPEPGAPAEVG
jgi:hypothetical protein